MAKFKIGDKVRAKDPAWPGYQGHALGNDVYVVKKVDWDGTVKLDGFIDVWVSPGSLISANAARNAVTDKSWDGKQLSVGDWVRQKDSGLIGRIVGKYNNYLWNVKWRDGNDTFVEGAAPDDLIFMRHDTTAINAVRSRNDILGRNKPGARVSVELRTRPIVGKVLQYGGRPIVEYSPTTRTRFTGTLIKQNGNKWDIKSDSGEVYKSVSEADFGLSYNSLCSRNAVVQKALNAMARNIRAIPVDSKGKGIIERCKIRTADGEVAEVSHIDEDGFVYFKAKDGRIRGVPADTVVRLNAATSTVRAKACNAAARNAADDFVQYHADSHSYIPKVGETYEYDGKRVKCTSVQKLQRGSDDRDRYLIEGRVVG